MANLMQSIIPTILSSKIILSTSPDERRRKGGGEEETFVEKKGGEVLTLFLHKTHTHNTDNGY